MSREGYYWKIRDKSLPWEDRVKLVLYAWKSDNVHIPNKHQMLLDWLVYAVGEKKLTVEERSSIWMCLHDVLHTQKCHGRQQTNGQSLKLKSSIVLILVDELKVISEDKTSKKIPCSPDVIISCCNKIVTSPAFGNAVIGMQDAHLFQMLGVILTVFRNKLNSATTLGDDLIELMDNLLDKLHHMLIHRPNIKQHIFSFTEKLLEPIIILLDREQDEDNTKFGTTYDKRLKNILCLILFNRDLMAHYEGYLMLKLPQSDTQVGKNKHIPKFIDVFFSKLTQFMVNDSKKLAVFRFLPKYFRGFVDTFRDSETNGLSFHMIQYLVTEILKINLDNPGKTSYSLNELQVKLKCINELLEVVQETDIYSVSEDNSGEQIQLKWYKSIASWILNIPQRPAIWYACLSTLLDLNHVILADKLTLVLKKTLTTSKISSDTTNEDCIFIKKLTNLFEKLRQLPKFIGKLLVVVKDEPLLPIPDVLSESIGECITQLPTVTVYEIWEMMAQDFISGEDYNSAVANLFSKVLLSTQLTDHNMIRLSEMSSKMWEENLKDTVENVISKDDIKAACTCLDLVHSFGEVQILLKYYQPAYSLSCPEFFNSDCLKRETESKESETGVFHLEMMDCSYIYPGISKKVWKNVGMLVQKELSQLIIIGVKLMIQKLKAMQLFENRNIEQLVCDIAENLRNFLCNMERFNSEQMLEKDVKVKVYDIMFDHLHLFNKLQDVKQCKELLKMVKKCNRSMTNCVQFQENDVYHKAHLSGVRDEILAIEDGTNVGESSPKKRKKHKRKSTSEEDKSTAVLFIDLIKSLQRVSNVKVLTDEDSRDLLAAIMTQEVLPFEYLSEENGVMCIVNIISTLKLLHEPVMSTLVQSKIVELCYTQSYAVLSNFSQWTDWFEMADIISLLQYLLSFQKQITHKNSHLEKYLCLVESLLKPLLRSEKGLPSLIPYIAELIEICREETKDSNTVNTVGMATVSMLMKFLSRNMLRGHLSEDIRKISTSYFQYLSALCDYVIGKMLQQKYLNACDANVVDVCSVMVDQYCKSQRSEGEEPCITDHLKPLCQLCTSMLNVTVHRDIKTSCIRLISTVCQHHTHLVSHLSEDFLQKSWDAVLSLCENQETKSLYTTHGVNNIHRNVSDNCKQYNVSSQLNELLRTLNKFTDNQNESPIEIELEKRLSDSSLNGQERSSKTGSKNKESGSDNGDLDSDETVVDADLQNTLGSIMSKADHVQFKLMLEELLKGLENPLLENLTEGVSRCDENSDNNFITPVSQRTFKMIEVAGSTDEQVPMEKGGKLAKNLDFNDCNESQVTNEVEFNSAKAIASQKEFETKSLCSAKNVDGQCKAREIVDEIKGNEALSTEQLQKEITEIKTLIPVNVKKEATDDTTFQYKEEITALQGERDILSNFYPCTMKYGGLDFKSSLQAYEYQKALHYNNKLTAGHILFASNAWEAKMMARSLFNRKLNQLWHQKKEAVMKDVLSAKANYVPEFRRALLNSGRIIVEAVKGEKFWSPGLSKCEVMQVPQQKWPGRNIMGKILMNLRDQIRREDLAKAVSESVCDTKGNSVLSKLQLMHNRKLCSDDNIEYSVDPVRNWEDEMVKQKEDITIFQGANDVLSNFYLCRIELWNQTFASAEHAYYYKKAASVGNYSLAKSILREKSAAGTKHLTKKLGKIPAWEVKKEAVMMEIIEAKLKCVPQFREALFQAGDTIVEAVARNKFWSAGLNRFDVKTTPQSEWPGQNRLGKLMMYIRDRLVEEKETSITDTNCGVKTEKIGLIVEEKKEENGNCHNIDQKEDFNIENIKQEIEDGAGVGESNSNTFYLPFIKVEKETESIVEAKENKTVGCHISGQSSDIVVIKQEKDEDKTGMSNNNRFDPSPIEVRKETGNIETERNNNELTYIKDVRVSPTTSKAKRKSDEIEDKPKPEEKLTTFNGSHDVLSNFYACRIEMFGQVFRSSLQAYYYKRAVHANRPDLLQLILEAKSALDAKRISKKFPYDTMWEKNKGNEMMAVLKQKARCVPEFRGALLNAGDTIAEANEFDKFWSAGLNSKGLSKTPKGQWPGKNVLGKLLMSLKEKLIKQENSHSGPARKKLKKEQFMTSYEGQLVEKVTAFQGYGDVMSNFYPCKIYMWDKTFSSSEHAYQYQKALYSNRKDSAQLILYSPSALGAKKLSREILTDSLWELNKVKVMKEIIRAKADCVPEFKQALLTSERIIAECVASDKFWSCGLSKSNVKTTPRKHWPGRNIMGELLMELKAELLQECDVLQYFDPVSMRVGCTINSLKTWQKLVNYELTQSQWNILGRVIQQVVLKAQQLLTQCEKSTYQIVTFITTLDMLATFLFQGPILLSSQSVSTCLHGCILAPLSDKDLDIPSYTGLHKAVYGVLNQMLVYHPETVCKCIPSYLTAVKPFLVSVIIKGRQRDLPLQPTDESALVSSAQLVDRLLTLMCTYKEDFGKVALYVVADYVNEIQKVTLIPAVKKSLLPGIYKLLDLCDKHAIAQLYTVLASGPREIFKTLHQEYAKYYKYTGKV